MSAGSCSILAIHDRAVREAFTALLADFGLSVTAVCTEAELLAAVASEQAALVVMDAEIQRPDAVELCRRIKSDPAFAAPVILRIPASTSESARQSAFSAEADAWLAEPYSSDAAKATIRAALRLGRDRRELAESTRRIRQLQAQVSRAQSDLEVFAGQVVHDAEDPLRGVATFVELISDRPDGRITDEDRTYVGYILAAGSRFQRLLRSGLSYALAGRMDPQGFSPVDLRVAAAAAMQALRRAIEQSGASIQFDGQLPRITGDFGEMQQVFEHLISNAILYCRRGTAPAIRIGAASGAADEWILWIADNGPGVPEDRRNVVFQPFKRLHGHETPGSGMGLAIARKIVEAHGGRIWIESAESGGACVRVSLPADDGGGD